MREVAEPEVREVEPVLAFDAGAQLSGKLGTSAIFAGLEKDFESQAIMHDADAEHRRRGLDR